MLEAKRTRLVSSSKDFDMISELPDSLICHILYHLPTKQALKTSVLSTRWKTLGIWVPCLDLASSDFQNFNAFVSFGDSFFDRVSCIQKVKLAIDDNVKKVDGALYLRSWIDAAVKRKIQHLDVSCPPGYSYEMPLSLYMCKTLVYLKLNSVNVVNAEFASLPCLKTMYLETNWYPNEATFEKLVSCCSVLEELKVEVAWNDTKVFRVHSRSLKMLTFVRVSPVQFDSVMGVVIDAPLLHTLSINDHVSESFIVNNLQSNVKLDVSLLFGLWDNAKALISSRRSSICNFLLGVSRIRKMRISWRTFKVICRYSKLEPLPQFGCMSSLCLTLCLSNLEWLPTFLENCPNLKSLVLDWNGNSKMQINEMSQPRFSSVPQCLLSSLQLVDIKSGIFGYAVEMKIVRYFLENSAILKKLTMRLHCHAIQDEFVNKLLEIPRCSMKCEVLVFEFGETM